ncbi:MAG TPA: (2Fe-2S)-binding protein [Bryobacteraceae bacterium]|nr:(2Fe-2S)-binding protein [Bryobacteraceae bacterium]
MPTEIIVNGVRHAVDAEPEAPLLSVLRDDLELTGTKYGCGEGQCGACTVLIDGAPAHSCITRLASVAGKRITTIEGLAAGGRLHPVQEAFLHAGAMQCGYCTAGMIVASAGLLASNPNPSEAQIKQALEGNICRCGTYPRIVGAVRMAARSGGPHA